MMQFQKPLDLQGEAHMHDGLPDICGNQPGGQRPDAIRISGMSVSYGSVTAVRSLDLVVEGGEFFCLLGPSGCGKSTTLLAICGLQSLRKGRIEVAGRDVTSLPARQRNIGVVFQSYALFPHMTVQENVSYGLRIRGQSKSKIRQRVDELLALVRLQDKADRYPRQLSGGEQQRVALARALAPRPSLILLDEPLSNLDAKLRQEMQRELKRIHKSTGVTMVLVTHDQEEAFSLADRIAIMSKGVVEQLGRPQDLYHRPVNRFVAGFIGQGNFIAGRLTKDGSAIVLENGVASFEVSGAPETHCGSACSMLLRPEDLSVSKAKPSKGNSLSGRVLNILPHGSTTTATVETACGQLDALTLTGDQDLDVGDRVWVGWKPEKGHIIPGAEGESAA